MQISLTKTIITITPNPANAASAKDATNNQTGAAHRMALIFHGLNTTSTDDNEDEGDDDSDTNNVMIRNECMAEFNHVKQRSVSIPLYKADGFFGNPLEW